MSFDLSVYLKDTKSSSKTHHVIVISTSFASGNCESMRIGSGTRPKHSEGSKVRDRKSFSDVNASYSTWTLDDDISPLTSFPTRKQKIVQPSTEL